MTRFHSRLVFSIFLGLLLAACGDDPPIAAGGEPVSPYLDEKAMDRSVDPCDDFYSYACGTWIKNTEIPAGYSRWTKSFNVLFDENLTTLKSVLEGYAAGQSEPATSSSKQLGDYYSSCVDTAGAETSTAKYLPLFLAGVEAISSKEDLMSSLVDLHAKGVNGFFSFFADQDYKDAGRMIGVIDRAGMGLPDREYYLDESSAKVKLRGLYVAHVARMLQLSGLSDGEAATAAASVLAIETELAKNSLKKEERRDPEKIYHLIGASGLKALAPNIDWDRYLRGHGRTGLEALNVAEPEFFKGLGAVMNQTSLDDLRRYVRWHLLHAVASRLSQAYVDEDFAFYGKALSGKKEQLPRWKTCVNATSGALGEALGEAYVRLKFNEESKKEAETLIKNVRAAVSENFSQVAWMDSETRARAVEKLDRIVSKMGYPEKFLDYSKLGITRESYLINELAAREFENRRNLAKIGQPTDRAEWHMVPQEVNAYYNPNLNEIVFPAAILQSPFFNVKAPTPVNYGGIGMVIGHEITHAFDDEGRQFDSLGNLSDWWTASSAKAFEERAECLVKQYGDYTVAGDVHLNGKLTLGENIADLGGLKLAHAAYRKATAGQPIPELAGLNADQQFFVGFAQGWCSKMTPEEEKLRAATDPHAHPRYRVNGVVVNLAEFQLAFGCRTGKPMAPKDRCTIW